MIALLAANALAAHLSKRTHITSRTAAFSARAANELSEFLAVRLYNSRQHHANTINDYKQRCSVGFYASERARLTWLEIDECDE